MEGTSQEAVSYEEAEGDGGGEEILRPVSWAEVEAEIEMVLEAS